MDELAHIPAGYGYARYLDYRLNPEHPPLLKALAAAPLLILSPHFPAESAAWTTDVNGQWIAGSQFLYESGNDAETLVFWSRLLPVLLTLLTGVLIYIWARELMGPVWAAAPTALFLLSPHVLAHGRYVTTDAVAALGAVGSAYFFLKFLLRPSPKHLVWAGLAFGVAQLTKFSAVLLVPYFALLLFAFYLFGLIRDFRRTDPGSRLPRFGKRAWRYLRSLAVIFVIGYLLVVYPAYALFTWNYPPAKQTADTTYILQSFAQGPPPPGETCRPVRCLAEANILLTKHAATRPIAQYMLGVLMVMQRSSGGNTAYFLGQVSAKGSPWYFPVAYALKEPLPVILLVAGALAFAFVAAVTAIRRRGFGGALRRYFDHHFSQFAILLFVVFYWAYSIKSPLNIGFRHLFPALPFLYILTAGAWQRWIFTHAPEENIGNFPAALRGWLRYAAGAAAKYALFVVLLFWFLLESLFAYPHYLSYFNQIGGGTAEGYRYITDSNYDWGQDLLRLRDFMNAHPEIDRIAVDYFGGGSVPYFLGGRAAAGWSSEKGDPRDSGIRWFAVSVNNLQGGIQPRATGFNRRPEDEYRWLTAARNFDVSACLFMGCVPEPDYKAGASIFIYKLQ